MIISFGWTTQALLAGDKTVTRREWNPKHAARFKHGMLVDAWNTSPRNVKGNPHKVATICIDSVELRPASWLPPEDWYAEGFDYMEKRALLVDGVEPSLIWHLWEIARPDQYHYVVRFEVVNMEGS